MDALHNHKLALAFSHGESEHKTFTFLTIAIITDQAWTNYCRIIWTKPCKKQYSPNFGRSGLL